MRGVLKFAAFVFVFVGICGLGQGAFDVSLEERNSGENCYFRDAPAAADPESVRPLYLAWPLGLACVWSLHSGAEFVVQPDWHSTWLVYGGGALVAVGSAVAIASRRPRTTSGPLQYP